MSDTALTQAEADALIAVEKVRLDDTEWAFPEPGERLAVPLVSKDRRENFFLDVARSRIKLSKGTFQNRGRQAIVLMRLDVDGPPHRNPDGVEVPCPHLHVFREGFGTKWAVPVPAERYQHRETLAAFLSGFMAHCNITETPLFRVGLF